MLSRSLKRIPCSAAAVLRDACAQSLKELDFLHEARNMGRVAANLRAAGIDVLLAQPITGTCFLCSSLLCCAWVLVCFHFALHRSRRFAGLVVVSSLVGLLRCPAMLLHAIPAS
jgi:hypothetical protein